MTRKRYGNERIVYLSVCFDGKVRFIARNKNLYRNNTAGIKSPQNSSFVFAVVFVQMLQNNVSRFGHFG